MKPEPLLSDPYRAAHRRVKQLRGPAKDYQCIACGNPARDWALQPTNEELTDEQGRQYSDNVEDYAPMCRSCHKTLDRAFQHIEKWQSEDPERNCEMRSEAGKKGVAVAAPKLSEHRAGLAELNRKAQRRCLECGFVSGRTGLGRHQQSGGHRGYEDV